MTFHLQQRLDCKEHSTERVWSYMNMGSAGGVVLHEYGRYWSLWIKA